MNPAESSQDVCTKMKNMTWIDDFLSAAKAGDTLKIRAFLRGNQSIGHLVKCESTNAFMLASEFGRDKTVQMLLELAPIDLNRYAENAKTALYIASQNNHIKVAEMLLYEDELNVNLAELLHGETPLYVASKLGHINMTYLLMKKTGINVERGSISSH